MKFIRFFIGLIVGMFLLTVLTEGIEFIIIKTLSGDSFEYLSTHQKEYFEIRNQPLILFLKIIYTLGASFLAGFVATYIAQKTSTILLVSFIGIQLLGIIYGAFFSEFSDSTPLWMWVTLMVLIPLGIFYGYLRAEKLINISTNKQE